MKQKWYMTEPQKLVMRRILAGETLLWDALGGTYYWAADKVRCTSSVKSLCKHGYLTAKPASSPNWTGAVVLTSKAKSESSLFSEIV